MSYNETASSFERVAPQIQHHRHDKNSLRRKLSLAIASAMLCLTLPFLLSDSKGYQHRGSELLSWSNSFDDGTGVLSGQQHGVTRTIVSCDADDPSCSFIVSPEDYAHGKWVSTKGEPSHEKYVQVSAFASSPSPPHLSCPPSQIRKDRLQPSSYEDDIDLGPAAGEVASGDEVVVMEKQGSLGGLRNVKSGADYERVRVPDRDSDYEDGSYDDVVGLKREWRDRSDPRNYRRERTDWVRKDEQHGADIPRRSSRKSAWNKQGDSQEEQEEDKLRRDLDSLKRNRKKEKSEERMITRDLRRLRSEEDKEGDDSHRKEDRKMAREEGKDEDNARVVEGSVTQQGEEDTAPPLLVPGTSPPPV
eukprot:437923-Hanusia_phi.AAC.3